MKENLFKLLTAEELIILEDTYVKKFNVKRKLNLPMKVKINLFSLITVDDYFMLEKRYQRLSNASSIKPSRRALSGLIFSSHKFFWLI